MLRSLGRSSLLASFAVGATLLLGACRSPQSLCQEYMDHVNVAYDACGVAGEAVIVDPRDPERSGCGIVSGVSNPDEIVSRCIPFLERVASGEVACDDERFAEFPENAPYYCDPSHFTIFE